MNLKAWKREELLTKADIINLSDSEMEGNLIDQFFYSQKILYLNLMVS